MSIFPWVMDAGRLRNSFFGGRTTFSFSFSWFRFVISVFPDLTTTERCLARYTEIAFCSPKLAPGRKKVLAAAEETLTIRRENWQLIGRDFFRASRKSRARLVGVRSLSRQFGLFPI
jgi:hypothetical protein